MQRSEEAGHGEERIFEIISLCQVFSLDICGGAWYDSQAVKGKTLIYDPEGRGHHEDRRAGNDPAV